MILIWCTIKKCIENAVLSRTCLGADPVIQDTLTQTMENIYNLHAPTDFHVRLFVRIVCSRKAIICSREGIIMLKQGNP